MPPAVHGLNPSLRPAALSPHRHRLSTDGIADGDCFAYWLDMICAMYALLECDRPKAEVHGQTEFSHLGAVQLTEVHSSVQFVGRTPSMIRADTRDACLLMIQRRGRARVVQDGRARRGSRRATS